MLVERDEGIATALLRPQRFEMPITAPEKHPGNPNMELNRWRVHFV
jgi:hypothetical protein